VCRLSFVKFGTLSQLWIGESAPFSIDQHEVVVFRTANGIFAYEDKCPHLGFALSKGKLKDTTLTCAAHCWQFNAETGKGVNPADACLKRYEVELRDDEIWIELSPS
jgi:toluene monooxygenase system ferredoxin subunit